MKNKVLTSLLTTVCRTLAAGALLVTAYATPAVALPAGHYASNSVLAQGTWVKIGIDRGGVHCIDAATLQAWGFPDASQVSIYGKDGYMLPETFSTTDTDDLAEIPAYVEDGNLYFYATGSVQWNYDYTVMWNHTNNYYSNTSYLFLTTNPNPLRIERVHTGDITDDLLEVTFYSEHLLHEKDELCMGQTGRLYVGENLIQQPTLTLHAPGVVGDNMHIYVAMAANATSSYTLPVTVNGTQLTPNISVSASDSYTYAKEGRRLFTIAAAEELNLTFTSSGSGTLNTHFLDFIRLIYNRNLVLDTAQVAFRNDDLTGGYYAIDPGTCDTTALCVWNVADPANPHAVATQMKNGKVSFISEGAQVEYVAFDKTGDLPAPHYVGVVENQDLHGTAYIPDMVIVTTRYFEKEAERIAEYHRTVDNMKVLVCDQLAVFNEFSGGTPDATAIRRMMKMFYDRAQAGYGDAPRYLLLYGRGSYNNRAIAGNMHNEDNRLLVTYQSPSSTDSRYSYVTDDYFAFLADDSGKDLTSDVMYVGVGRMPVADLNESQAAYRKLMRYVSQQPLRNLWKNRACFIGFNGDSNLHIRQIDNLAKITVEVDQPYMVIDKVYRAAYPSTSRETFVGARERMYNDLDEGTILFDYMGHAGPQGIDGLMDVATSRSLKNELLPIYITATCDACPFDKDEVSFGEELFINENGGFISLFTTTRTVYTNGNEDINRELLKQFFVPGIDGKVRTGDVMRYAKEALTVNASGTKVSDPNKLKYCLIGDPAMVIPLPTYDIEVLTINGTDVTDGSANVILPANSTVTITGVVNDTEGSQATDFDGTVCFEVYDAPVTESCVEKINTTTTLTYNFDVRNYKLAFAADTVVGGQFEATFRLPVQCLQSDLTGLISLYAFSNDYKTEAKGYCDRFVIDGVDESDPDETAPTIDNVWIDNASFCEGDAVPASTTFHCEVSDDNSGVMISEVALGKGMSLWLDGVLVTAQLGDYFTPAMGSDGGSIDYPLNGLGVGSHVATVRIFDNAGNSAERSVAFVVEEGETYTYDLTVESDVVTDVANMSLSGVVADGMSVRYVVADAYSGREVWSRATTAMQASWNTADVAPGHYVARAYITVGSNHLVTAPKKIVVVMQ